MWLEEEVVEVVAQRYVDDVLHPVAVPYLRRFPGMALQHDSTRSHVARLTTQYLINNNMTFWKTGHHNLPTLILLNTAGIL